MSKYINLPMIKQFLIGLRNAFDNDVLYNDPMTLWRYGEYEDPYSSALTTVLVDPKTQGFADLTLYKRLLIEYVSIDNVHSTVTILIDDINNTSDTKCFNIWDWSANTLGSLYLRMSSYQIKGVIMNGIVRWTIGSHWKHGQKIITPTNSIFTQGVYFKITKVIGYKH